ncbi:MAG: hypothetical protein HC836_15905 [Richelia sp. RM2_1_2]|nr:hypothetical protein [Richelia sp. SM1_7_0]NJO59728.1 hypothetical protein [Richelia sp. RM2_1_2]
MSEPAVRASRGFAVAKKHGSLLTHAPGDERTSGTGSRGRTRNWGAETGGRREE